MKCRNYLGYFSQNLDQFWTKRKLEYPQLTNKAIKCWVSFATPYLCQLSFSSMTNVRNCFELQNDIIMQVSNTEPIFEKSVSEILLLGSFLCLKVLMFSFIQLLQGTKVVTHILGYTTNLSFQFLNTTIQGVEIHTLGPLLGKTFDRQLLYKPQELWRCGVAKENKEIPVCLPKILYPILRPISLQDSHQMLYLNLSNFI